jgi:predicted  nucleic acid-binding Zn-ribbon protein
MLQDIEDTTKLVVSARARVARLAPSVVAVREIDDVLTQGYARALEGDAWLMQAEERLHDLIDNASAPKRGRELRTIAREHDDVQQSVIELRRELEALREERTRMRARSRAGSS